MKKKVVLLGSLFFAIFIGYRYMCQEHRNISSEDEIFHDTATVLKQYFYNNSSEGDNKYLNKTVVVYGEVSEVEGNAITINDDVYCVFDKNVNESIMGKYIKIKGRCIGYDELLEVVKIDQSVLLN